MSAKTMRGLCAKAKGWNSRCRRKVIWRRIMVMRVRMMRMVTMKQVEND